MTSDKNSDITVQNLRKLTSTLGLAYGSSEICHFLYSIIKMHRPESVVELGAGLGISTFWMALALQENETGHLWAVDDFVQHDEYLVKFFPRIQSNLQDMGITLDQKHSAEEYFNAAENLLNLKETWTLVQRSIDLKEPNHFDEYPFGKKTIDLLFTDFASTPEAILQQFVHFLPRMSECSSLFIDSVPTIWDSYFFLNNLIDKINSGHIPRILSELLSKEEMEIILDRRYTLVHLTYNPDGHQSGTSWVKIEPHDIVPYPKMPFR